MNIGCVPLLALGNTYIAMTMGCINILEFLISVLLGVYPEVELLGHMVILCLIFLGTAILFSAVTAPLYISTSSALRFQFLQVGGRYCSYFSVT